MPWLWDLRTQQMHDLSRAEARCGLEGFAEDQAKTYEDERTAATVLKTRHLVPCRFCWRAGAGRPVPPGSL
jgi:hypothetical protein